MIKIKKGNSFIHNWAINWNGVAEDFSDATDIVLTYNVRGRTKEFTVEKYKIEGNIIKTECTPEICDWVGQYRLELKYTKPSAEFSEGERRSAVDVRAFQIVETSDQTDATQDISVTSDAVAGFALKYEDLTDEQKDELRGKGIASIQLTAEDGDVKTYTITYADGLTFDFPVRDGHSPIFSFVGTTLLIDGVPQIDLKGETGNGIASVELTSTVGLVKTYTITFTDDITTTFTVTDGAAAVVQEKGSNTGIVMSQKAVTDELAAKAAHGYSSNPKTLKEVDDSLVQLAGDVSQKAPYGDAFSVKGFYLKDNGTLNVYANSKVTPFIPLDISTDLIIVGHESTAQRVCVFYDKYQNFISYYSTGESNKSGRFVIHKSEFPPNAIYFRANALVSQVDAKIESLNISYVANDFVDKSLSNIRINDGIFDKEKSDGNYLKFSEYIDDIMIINPEEDAVYTVDNISPNRVAVRKNGNIYADNQYVTGNESEWFKVNPTFGVLSGGEQIMVKYNPSNTPILQAKGSNIISKNKYYHDNDFRLEEILQKKLYETTNYDDAKLQIARAIKEIYIQGYNNTQAYIGYIRNVEGEVEIRIQSNTGSVIFSYEGVPKEIIHVIEPNKKIIIAIDWSKISGKHSALYSRAWHKLSDRCFNLAYCPIANSFINTTIRYSGNILEDGVFANPGNFTDRLGDFVCDFTEAGGYSMIEHSALLGVNMLSSYKFAPSNFSPSPNFKIKNALIKGFEGNDKFRIRGKIYVDKGDATYADDISISLRFMKDGSYPEGADVVGATSSILVKNKVWKDFEFIGILGDDLGVQNVSFRPTFAEHNPIVAESKSISITQLSVEFFKDGENMPSEITTTNNVFQRQNIVESVVSVLKADDSFMKQLVLNKIKTYNYSADIFLSKLQTLITQSEILYLKDSHRMPSMSKNAIVVEEGVLYYYQKGKKYSVDLTEII